MPAWLATYSGATLIRPLSASCYSAGVHGANRHATRTRSRPWSKASPAPRHVAAVSNDNGFPRLRPEVARWAAEHLEAGVPTLAELDPEELLNAFPGAELDPTDVDRAAEVIACSLTGSPYVIGRWWPSAPIRRALAVYGITDETVIDAALGLLKVQVQKQGATGARWMLERNPELPRPAIERTAKCPCDQRSREWRLATGGPWTCLLCHPPAEGLQVEHCAGAEHRQ